MPRPILEERPGAALQIVAGHHLGARGRQGFVGRLHSLVSPSALSRRNSAFAMAPNYRVEVADDRTAELIRDRVRRVPAGFVTTYGDLCPEAPRFAGQVLSHTHDPGIPWQRIVRADGSLAKGEEQRRLLEAEGVEFRGSRVDMEAAWIAASDLA